MTWWQQAWHWLTTSRYTRRLEAEIVTLKADNERLRADNDGLLRALYPAIRSIRTEHDVQKEVTTAPKLTSFNWRR
jgi:hypothetical protein